MGACVKEVYLEMDVVLNVIKKLRSCFYKLPKEEKGRQHKGDRFEWHLRRA